MSTKQTSKAYFALKRKVEIPQSPFDTPMIVCFVESYDDGLDMAERRNHYADGDPYFVDVVHV